MSVSLLCYSHARPLSHFISITVKLFKGPLRVLSLTKTQLCQWYTSSQNSHNLFMKFVHNVQQILNMEHLHLDQRCTKPRQGPKHGLSYVAILALNHDDLILIRSHKALINISLSCWSWSMILTLSVKELRLNSLMSPLHYVSCSFICLMTPVSHKKQAGNSSYPF